MPGNFPQYEGQAFQPSGGPQPMSPEQKLQSMIQTLQGAPNDVINMIARILSQGQQQGQPQGQPQEWQRAAPMPPPPIPMMNGINGAMPMRPSEPSQPPMMFPDRFVRG